MSSGVISGALGSSEIGSSAERQSVSDCEVTESHHLLHFPEIRFSSQFFFILHRFLFLTL